jgi:Zn-dependent metalloprotease
MKDKYTGHSDNNGVHINSGIPNHAFYRVAMEIGGYAWEKAGQIWYKTQLALYRTSDFQDAANTTYEKAATLYGVGSKEQQAVKTGWKAVGIDV